MRLKKAEIYANARRAETWVQAAGDKKSLIGTVAALRRELGELKKRAAP